MAKKLELREQVIQNIMAEVHKKLPAKEAQQLEEFAHQYYAFVAEEDLKACTIYDLLSHWQFLKERKPDEIKVHIFNPQFEQHGWQSNHTIIEVVSNDLPFLVDSILMALLRKNLTVHLLINPPAMQVERNAQGKLTHISPANSENSTQKHESIVHIEIDRQNDKKVLHDIEQEIRNIIRDVEMVVADWQPMSQAARNLINELEAAKLSKVAKEDKQEVIDFLDWMDNGHFTFLASCEYKVVEENGQKVWSPVARTGLGLLRNEGKTAQPVWLKDMVLKVDNKIQQHELLIIRKLIELSTVHRATAPYSISILRMDEQGKVVGELRFIGLLTSAAYNNDIETIPVLRRKVDKIIERSGLPIKGHAGKELLNILATFPRDEIFQGTIDDLYAMAMGVMHMQNRPVIRLFIRRDRANRFFSCMVYVPRDIFSSKLRQRIGEILCENLQGTNVTFHVRVSELSQARIHFVILLPPDAPEIKYDREQLEQKLMEAGRTWEDDLKIALTGRYGEVQAVQLFARYRSAFPAGYRESFSAAKAVLDIEHCEKLHNDNVLEMSFYRLLEQQNENLNLKLYHLNSALPLSDILPMLENMGLRILSESSYPLNLADGQTIWLSDFSMQYQQGKSVEVSKVKEIFQDAFANIWLSNVENDRFNRLVLAANLTWRQINILRAYAKFFRQIGVTFSQSYIEQALVNHPNIAQLLIDLFEIYFSPEQKKNAVELANEKSTAIIQALDSVSSLDEDRILRRYLNVINATMRTNYYQHNAEGQPKDYLSFKIKSSLVSDMPLPHPLFEIFVYSPRVEGVHLRSAKVARGGLRWSDRFEDFRTEVLGLMKAQQVKNSVIVPAGAKGGFVCKRLPTDGNRDNTMKEVVNCYSTFISGLLDITDNLSGEKVIPPVNVTRRDEDDPYLVVAADKGTATFSDTANAIAQKYNFWLGDAFASGGSAGYDHKKMGITARGAWVSVSRHFRELGVDIQKEDFTEDAATAYQKPGCS